MKASTLTDEQKSTIALLAKGWRNPVRRGDCTRAYAAEQVAGQFTYPHATVAHYKAVRAYARTVIA